MAHEGVTAAIHKWGRKYGWNFTVSPIVKCLPLGETRTDYWVYLEAPNYSKCCDIDVSMFSKTDGNKNSEILDGLLSQYITKYKQETGFL